jgi:hypothetical protein
VCAALAGNLLPAAAEHLVWLLLSTCVLHLYFSFSEAPLRSKGRDSVTVTA